LTAWPILLAEVLVAARGITNADFRVTRLN